MAGADASRVAVVGVEAGSIVALLRLTDDQALLKLKRVLAEPDGCVTVPAKRHCVAGPGLEPARGQRRARQPFFSMTRPLPLFSLK